MAEPLTALQLLERIDAGIQQLIRLATPIKPVKADLDGPHGDPVIKAKDPRDWSGPSMVGRSFSQTPAEYLDLLAERYDYFASKEVDPKKAKYNQIDAARARGWAARIRAGEVDPPPSADPITPDERW